ncbi:MAG: transcription antitermination factor NusB [Bacteroidales bacterium]|nr:transcription antitermination factor NusB [Bacteroidales bacterium]
MISRRIIRIKALQVLYAYFKCDDGSINKHEKDLFHSIEKTYELYHLIFLLLCDIKRLEQKRLDVAKNRLRPAPEDLTPNLRFVENSIIGQIDQNNQLIAYVGKTGIGWANHPELIKNLHKEIIESELYKTYMQLEKVSLKDEKLLVDKIITEVFYNSELFYQVLEEQSVFWNDEADFVLSNVSKTIMQFKPEQGANASLMELYKSNDDMEFAKLLFRKVVLNSKEHLGVIKEFTTNWELERVAFMDKLIMQMAIAEILEFPSIPVRVSLNEYIEIAKLYSTRKSNTFVNGILDKIITRLKEENKIQKTGRGLLGEEKTEP